MPWIFVIVNTDNDQLWVWWEMVWILIPVEVKPMVNPSQIQETGICAFHRDFNDHWSWQWMTEDNYEMINTPLYIDFILVIWNTLRVQTGFGEMLFGKEKGKRPIWRGQNSKQYCTENINRNRSIRHMSIINKRPIKDGARPFIGEVNIQCWKLCHLLNAS